LSVEWKLFLSKATAVGVSSIARQGSFSEINETSLLPVILRTRPNYMKPNVRSMDSFSQQIFFFGHREFFFRFKHVPVS